MITSLPLADLQNLLEFCKGLANENRQRIVFEIFGDKQSHTVGEVAQSAGIALSTASAHLAILKRAGILTSRKDQKEVFYRIDTERVSGVINALTAWRDCC